MRAWVFVFEHPYYTLTDADGRFQLGPLPPGRYRVAVRQPDAGFSGERTVEVAGLTRIEWRFTAEDLRAGNGRRNP